jgi:hypothetical protein
MSFQFKLVLASLVVVSSVAGCGSIRVVKKTPDGGIVALAGDQGEARKKADDYMTSQCGGPYEIVEEGEAVIGEVNSAESRPTGFGTVRTNGSSTQKTEWRLTFRCKARAGQPANADNGGPQRTSELHTFVVVF